METKRGWNADDKVELVLYSAKKYIGGHSDVIAAFEAVGGEPEALALLNHLKLVKLAVSLGSTESLAQHPASMTHAGVAPEEKLAYGITDNLV